MPILLLAACTSQPNSSADDESSASVSPAATPVTSPPATPTPESTPTPEPKELPNGGRVLFPNYRLCGFVGYPGAEGQGRLGIGDVNERMIELHDACAPYALDRPIMPVMELIATTVHPVPGPDGMWRGRTEPAIIDYWLEVARQNNAILLLDIQPGQASFIDEVRALEPYLAEPDVGVALDPEWAMAPGQIPMDSFGSTSGEELDEVATYLSNLVEERQLPDKVMVYHVLHPEIITNEEALQPHPGVALVKSADGIGSPGAKVDTYNRVAGSIPPGAEMGFKLFYEEDVDTSGILMTPDEVMALTPTPSYIMYE